MSRYYEVLRRANVEQELFQRLGRLPEENQDDRSTPAEVIDKTQDSSPSLDRPVARPRQATPASVRPGEAASRRPRPDLEAHIEREQALFHKFGRPVDEKQVDLPTPAEPAEKVQDPLPRPVEPAATAKRTAPSSVRPEEIVYSKRPRSNLDALNQSEEIKLVQRVFMLPGTEMPRVVVFSGIGQGTGCSTICARASETLASLVTGSVCVVDANLRTPHLNRYFGVVNRTGLTEAVLQSNPIRDFAQRLSRPNLWLITHGSVPSSPDALLTPDRLRPRIAELRSEFDCVLIDAPAVNHYGDTTLLGQLADGIVLVIEANSTRRETARKVKESLEAANLRVLAAVLNKRTFPIPNFLYRRL
jgi:protein-tyrosine kinase